MEGNATNGIAYWISINKEFEEALYSLRNWSHLRIGFDEQLIWIRDLSETEVCSKEVLQLPSVERYYLDGSRIYRYGNKLPDRIEPSILWTSIDRGLKVSLPKQNFNYFGIQQKVNIQLIQSEIEYPVHASVIDLNVFTDYIITAPKIRLEQLRWTILDKDHVLVLGTPILPIQGNDYYSLDSFLIPLGWSLNSPHMSYSFSKALPESNQHYYLISPSNTLSKIDKSTLIPLSRGSVRKTVAAMNDEISLVEKQ